MISCTPFMPAAFTVPVTLLPARAQIRCPSLTTAAATCNWSVTTSRVKIPMRRTPLTSTSRSRCVSAVAVGFPIARPVGRRHGVHDSLNHLHLPDWERWLANRVLGRPD